MSDRAWMTDERLKKMKRDAWCEPGTTDSPASEGEVLALIDEVVYLRQQLVDQSAAYCMALCAYCVPEQIEKVLKAVTSGEALKEVLIARVGKST